MARKYDPKKRMEIQEKMYEALKKSPVPLRKHELARAAGIRTSYIATYLNSMTYGYADIAETDTGKVFITTGEPPCMKLYR